MLLLLLRACMFLSKVKIFFVGSVAVFRVLCSLHPAIDKSSLSRTTILKIYFPAEQERELQR